MWIDDIEAFITAYCRNFKCKNVAKTMSLNIITDEENEGNEEA